MSRASQQAQHELRRTLLDYVREMEQHAPVELDAIVAFCRGAARRRESAREITDQVGYLVDCGDLDEEEVWEAGSVARFYSISAQGRDRLDGNIPPWNWKRE